jgi:hypothetical protein
MRPHSSSHEGAPSHEPSSSLPMPSAENISSSVSCSDYRTLLPLHLASHKLLRGARAPPARHASVMGSTLSEPSVKSARIRHLPASASAECCY